jgi:lipid A ethanolaminephosphotransferase
MIRHGSHTLEFTRANSGSAGRWRPELGVETLVLLVSVLLALIANLAFWRGALAGRSLGDLWTWRFSAATALALVMLHAIPLCLFATRHTVRALLAVLIVFSVLGSYFMLSYGVLLDASMLRNVLRTDIREASELVSASAIGAFVLALLAAASLWSVRLRRRTFKRALLIRTAVLGVCVSLGALAMASGFQDLSSVMRNNRSLRYTITPANIVWALGQIVLSDTHALAAPRAPSEPANRMMIASAGRKPTLLVIVLGETARAANFSLNGYTRTTNPQLARLDVINFGHTTACGTSTEVSLPCLFSPFGRADYDARRIRNHESLLHLLARAGLRVVWLDNQSGCKGVCDGLEFRDVSRAQIPGLCAEDHCYDEVLLHHLAPIVTDAGTDTVVVLHQIGNHGPAYFRRYPPAMKRFKPACERNELRECTREQIVNAYDNAIAYTDGLLANTIGFLDSQRARFDVALLYVSDHGESLGELGLYLHGMPYAIAPREQLHVPMLWWIPPAAARALDVDIGCFRSKAAQRASHDNIYHSVLGLLAVDTPSYKAERDLFDSCRAGSTPPNPQFAARDRPRIH